LHNVDEDIAAISLYGGEWCWESEAGIARRCMDRDVSYTTDTVASKKIIYLLPHRKEAYNYIFNI
jgi:hypothetical protein